MNLGYGYSIPELAERIRSGDRRALAKGLTLIENTHSDSIFPREQLLELLLPMSGSSWRIGITGSPGVGKSSLIETLGLHVVNKGRKVAVLAVDPSSSKSGGSILGDKVRMPFLALHDNSFIRPAPSQGTLGGVARRTRESIILCEAAGYDTIIIETVGVGQSETLVSSMVDVFLLLLLPTSGDEIQGVKRGIMELADILLVTKSDIDIHATNKAIGQLRGILSLLQPTTPDWKNVVISCSSRSGDGIDGIWTLLSEYFHPQTRQMAIAAKRKSQHHDWLQSMISSAVLDSLVNSPRFKEALSLHTNLLLQQKITPHAAVNAVLQTLHIS